MDFIKNNRLLSVCVVALVTIIVFTNVVLKPAGSANVEQALEDQSNRPVITITLQPKPFIGMGISIGYIPDLSGDELNTDSNGDELNTNIVPIVGNVFCGSPADVAGLRRGDSIENMNGVVVSGYPEDVLETAINAIITSPAGTPVTITVKRLVSEGKGVEVNKLTMSFKTGKIENMKSVPDCSPGSAQAK